MKKLSSCCVVSFPGNIYFDLDFRWKCLINFSFSNLFSRYYTMFFHFHQKSFVNFLAFKRKIKSPLVFRYVLVPHTRTLLMAKLTYSRQNIMHLVAFLSDTFKNLQNSISFMNQSGKKFFWICRKIMAHCALDILTKNYHKGKINCKWPNSIGV